VRHWTDQRIADAAGAELMRGRDRGVRAESVRGRAAGTEPARDRAAGTEPARDRAAGTEPARDRAVDAEPVRGVDRTRGAESMRDRATGAEPVRGVDRAHGVERMRGADRAADGPERVVIDSRAIEPGDLFVALPGERVDGGRFAADALRSGAWGVLAAPEWAREAGAVAGGGAVLAAEHPVASLGALARAWRRDLAAHVIAVTGSVGKTSTKDLIAALIAPHRTVAASRENFNTEIGLPLELLAAPRGTEVLVLELAMRGFGQIAELTAICEPDVGVITNVGPVHLEQMETLQGVARAKAELLVGMRDGATAVVPFGEPLLEPYLRDALEVVTFGPGGDIHFASEPRRDAVPSSSYSPVSQPAASPPENDSRRERRVVVAGTERHELELPFESRHNLLNTLAAVAAARAVGVLPSGRVDVRFGALRGERVELAGGAIVVNDCYNANPLSMRAALDDLAVQEPAGRRVAVLGDMLELGPAEREHHADIGAYAASAGVELLIAVGPRSTAMLDHYKGEVHAVADAAAAATLARELVEPGDVVLVKASRGVGLEVVAEALAAGRSEADAARSEARAGQRERSAGPCDADAERSEADA
jgi:UDP-N-acetylmuramoyl-tripeptide--D-alanyl-D-alanine ligase